MPTNVATILGIILALLSTVAAYIFIIPESRRKNLNKFLKILHDILTFKQLLIETILRFLYIFATLACISIGFFMLFSVEYGQSMFGIGLLMIIGAPILLRLIFELFMLTFIQVKNLIEINKKTPAPRAAAPRARRPENQSRQNYDSGDYNPYGE